MTDLPRITIVMPSLNQSSFIEESIQSVLNQKYPNLELLILDGGSSDGSQKIIDRYSDNLAYWHSHSDNGQTDAIIQGFSIATGELLGWLNSDDILLPGALFKIAQAYKAHPGGGIFGGNILVIDERSVILKCVRTPSASIMLASYAWCVICQPGSFFTRKDYDAVGGLHGELQFIMDADLYLRMMKNHIRYFKVNAWVSGFRLQSLSKTMVQGIQFDREYESVRQKYLPWTRSGPLARYFYTWMQIVNGNFLRMFFETNNARGKHWQEWCNSQKDLIQSR